MSEEVESTRSATGALGSWEDTLVTDPAQRASVISLLKGLLHVAENPIQGGLATIGATLDAGPAQSVTRTYGLVVRLMQDFSGYQRI